MKCTEFRAYKSNTLLGFATFESPSGMIISDCPVHEKDGKRWVNLPGRPMLDRDRNLITKDGKVQYAQVISFTNDEVREAWQKQALKALEAHGFAQDFQSGDMPF